MGSNDADEEEFDIESEEGRMPTRARSASRPAPVGGGQATTGKKAKSNPPFKSGFEGLNHYQQRYSRGGNQFSVEPPDQGMCAGNGYVVEAVNDVFNVFSQSGHRFFQTTRRPTSWPDSRQREPCGRPQLVLRLRAGDQPHHRGAGAGRDRSVLHL